MPQWLDYINRAFQVFYDSGMGGGAEEAIETFASRWGGLDLETFSHVLEVGEGQDKLIALFALGSSGQPGARARTLPFLHSQVRMERWASALCLGEVKEEQALPVLQEMLQEGLFGQGVQDVSMEDNAMWYELHRRRVASLLGGWGTPSLVPVLHQALQASWEREQQVRDPLHSWSWSLAHYHNFQDSLSFAMGKLGAFGALFGVEMPPTHLNMALIYLVLGYFHNSKKHGYHNLIGQLMTDKALRQDIVQVLEQRFGLSSTGGVGVIERYFDDYIARKDEER